MAYEHLAGMTPQQILAAYGAERIAEDQALLQAYIAATNRAIQGNAYSLGQRDSVLQHTRQLQEVSSHAFGLAQDNAQLRELAARQAAELQGSQGAQAVVPGQGATGDPAMLGLLGVGLGLVVLVVMTAALGRRG